MNTSSRLLFALIVVILLISCSSSSTSGDSKLDPGTFVAKTTGAIENEFDGEAKFTFQTLNDSLKQFRLSLTGGKRTSSADSSFASNYGLLLVTPMTSSNTLYLDNSDSNSLYVVPNSLEIMFIRYGSISYSQSKVLI
ncbi:hypothetical protein [Fodinibius sp.]|uniref:hypothetical protein n=1 Tax=Fodinibius sp. TaxID=1872440 RepID=UPI002ACDDD86|nr:hypothetical protein [Fodinibius sp.]MDZ7659485.1 hypothetical protein [Fodinibius sp.]